MPKNYVCQYVNSSIIQKGSVERMTMLRERFLCYIHEHSPDFYNPKYKTDKLKARLVKHFGDRIQFYGSKTRSHIVFSSNLTTGEAVEATFESATSETRLQEEAASILRRSIQCKHKSTMEMSWSPSSNEVWSYVFSPPACLTEFLTQITTGKYVCQDSCK